MKHYIIEANYLVPFDEIKDIIPSHRAFLQKGYELELFLCSGPKEPATGGFLVARAESKDAFESFFATEPFTIAKVAAFTFTEFSPVMRQGWAEHWFDEGG
jgi:uncharacterized protein YciI